ncbi:acyl-CoA transferase [Limimaricola pyoseonensis]|uniref:Acyl-CoA transferase n=1 Tax=Limimaricola pyoseonensis TaxID=521013 RepID=A0A1G7GPW4_9RHOB|nr:acyl-CoA transferase [Limimaricola pyoseonensis]SDE90190.1 hypothetical protein SAMN04488567_2875 [Limimaricola pyoseonensis]
MPTTIETILQALEATLASTMSCETGRGGTLPTRVPPSGLLILRDGEPGEPEMTMGPLTWHYEHRAEAEIYLSGDPETRTLRFDALRAALGQAIAADRTLGGLCEWVEAEAASAEDLPVEGGLAISAASFPIRLHYATTDPLG